MDHPDFLYVALWIIPLVWKGLNVPGISVIVSHSSPCHFLKRQKKNAIFTVSIQTTLKFLITMFFTKARTCLLYKILFDLCFNVPVNSYGHIITVS